jgi:phenylpropionate dioxygenase-like ring-hydroxylating dioxygenase large terminal subunit
MQQAGGTLADAPADKMGLMGEAMHEVGRKFGHVKTRSADAALLNALGERLVALVGAKHPDEAPAYRTVPASAYLDPAIFAAEKAAIFDRLPMLACLSSDIANPGDYRRVQELDTPIIVTRTRKGEVKAFVNGCRHRGAALVHEDSGSAKGGFLCPYHGWSYSDEGALKGIACPEAFEGLAKEDHGLVQVPCEERHGMVFIAPRADVPLDLDTHLGLALEQELALWRFAEVTGARSEPVTLKGNWKLVYETFLESYHFAQAHKNNLAAFYVPNVNTVDSYGPHQRIAVANRTLVDHFASHAPDERQPQDHLLVAYILFPGIVLINSPQVLEVFRIFPKSVDTTIVQHSCYSRLPEEMNGGDGFFEMVWQSAHNIVMNEDFPFGVTTAHRALASGSIGELLFGRNELAIHNNHDAIAAAMAARG